MKIALIAPTSGLERWSAMNHIHLVLAQIDDPKYVSFYKRRRGEGDLIILDNGAYERKLASHERLYEMTQEYNPQVVVLPDLPGLNAWTNFAAAEGYLYKHSEDCREYMFVPQTLGDDFSSWMASVDRAVSKLNCRWIGLPREAWRDLHITEPVYLRGSLAVILRFRYTNIKVHALGQFGKNPTDECNMLRTAGVYSMDTSGPIWRGWNGCTYFDPWPDLPLNFNAPLPAEKYYNYIGDNLRSIGFFDHNGRISREVIWP